MSSNLKVNNISALDANTGVTLSGDVYTENLLPKDGYGYQLRQVTRHFTLTEYSSDSGNVDPYERWPAFSCIANSKIQFHVYIPVRNTYGGWGGFFFQPLIRVKINGRTNYERWHTLGDTGHSIVMESGNDDIDHFTNFYWVDPHHFYGDIVRTNDFLFQVEYAGRSHSGTVYVNSKGQNDINSTTSFANGTSTYISSDEFNNWPFMAIVYYEYASKRGV